MRKFVVCGVQMDVKPADITMNLKSAINLVERSLKFEPNLIVFPEMFATGFSYPYIQKMAKDYFNEMIAFILNLAFKTNAYIVGGSIPDKGRTIPGKWPGRAWTPPKSRSRQT